MGNYLVLKGEDGLIRNNSGTETTIIDTSGNITAAANSIGSGELALNTIQTVEVTLTADEIVGTAAGDIGSTGGAILVDAVGAGNVIEFISATLIYDYDTAAYTGGGNDLVIRQNTVAQSAAIASADLLGASADKLTIARGLAAADIPVSANQNINLYSTAWTQPGTAAGVLRVQVQYRVHATGL